MVKYENLGVYLAEIYQKLPINQVIINQSINQLINQFTNISVNLQMLTDWKFDCGQFQKWKVDKWKKNHQGKVKITWSVLSVFKISSIKNTELVTKSGYI